ncbi:glycosyltransferase family 4 protein [Oceanitalea stevensii]|uniref:Glycosyltransferase family 4 protein n=1 Tax=Oceanitalea stevensii TaxID=2763072 RepID=A0ABR8Z6V3_9MICO|nr:glycosyltransferase family 4 protein [Oceanitalea stevensii]MBD8063718.1 glycosyltransferase family 4 protein [Oceanitalea stevensii]
MPALRFVVPARGDGPSGGDVYDACLARAWQAAHGPVEVLALPGSWPRPGPAEREALRGALGTSGTVVLDGLVGSACPGEVSAAVAAGVRVVLLVHLPLPAELGLPRADADRLAALESRTVHAASAVVTTSRWAAADLTRRYGRTGVLVAKPGAEPAAVAAGSRPPHLLALGALTRVKNHAGLVPALDAVRDLPWQATFAGPGTAQPAVAEHLLRALDTVGLADRVSLPGVVTGDALEGLWQRTDLLLVPSLVETYGLVVTEALAHGVPAVVSAGTGAVEALTGRPEPLPDDAAGTAVPPADPGAWARVLRRWLTDTEQRAAWRAAALARRQHLRTWADTAADLRRGLGPG